MFMLKEPGFRTPGCISHFSVAMAQHHDQGNAWKKNAYVRFWFQRDKSTSWLEQHGKRGTGMVTGAARQSKLQVDKAFYS